MTVRRKAREAALQFLFQDDFSAQGIDGGEAEDLTSRFEHFCVLYPVQKKARPYALELLSGVFEHLGEIDALIREHASNWRLERIAVTDRNLLRIAVCEIKFVEDTPDGVVINEAVEIAKRFGGGDSPAFVNGVLDAVKETLGKK
ncbi:MAG: transcription antitermination factor NusB [Thermodesulfobacteriota bacterium]